MLMAFILMEESSLLFLELVLVGKMLFKKPKAASSQIGSG